MPLANRDRQRQAFGSKRRSKCTTSRSRHVAPASDGGRRSAHRPLNEDPAMLSYAIMFLIIALISGVLGFGVVAGTAAWIAKVCFVVFLILFLVSLFTNRRVEV
jgi:uncharacterized membrane protein YtjA (UPF0391 family)